MFSLILPTAAPSQPSAGRPAARPSASWATALAAACALALLAGCGSRSWKDCNDATCRLETAEAAWKDNSDRVARDLGALDPVEQAGLVELLAHAYPAEWEAICAHVKSGSIAATRCEKLQLRPHLYPTGRQGSKVALPAQTTSAGRVGNMPRSPGVGSPWNKTRVEEAALRGDCGTDAGCIQSAAWETARNGDLGKGGLACELAWPEGSVVRDECVFQLAEQYVMNAGPTTAVAALSACGQAGTLVGHCVQHVLIEIAPVAPPADDVSLDDIATLTTIQAGLRESFPPEVAADYNDLLWSIWLRDAYSQASTLDGSLIPVLPAEALPHIRAGAAWKALNDDPTIATSLDDVAGYLKSRLKIQNPVAQSASSSASRRAGLENKSPRTSWNYDLTTREKDYPAIWCLGAGRRTTVGGPDDDLRIAVLEAAARLEPPPGAAFFGDVLGSEHSWTVRWTAARALRETLPDIAGRWMTNDADPRVTEALYR